VAATRDQERAIAISDLEVKLAEIQRGRAELADEVRDKVALAVLTSTHQARISNFPGDKQAGSSQASASGCGISFRQGGTDSYLGQQTSLDGKKGHSGVGQPASATCQNSALSLGTQGEKTFTGRERADSFQGGNFQTIRGSEVTHLVAYKLLASNQKNVAIRHISPLTSWGS